MGRSQLRKAPIYDISDSVATVEMDGTPTAGTGDRDIARFIALTSRARGCRDSPSSPDSRVRSLPYVR
jgi:hypothetical protein